MGKIQDQDKLAEEIVKKVFSLSNSTNSKLRSLPNLTYEVQQILQTHEKSKVIVKEYDPRRDAKATLRLYEYWKFKCSGQGLSFIRWVKQLP